MGRDFMTLGRTMAYFIQQDADSSEQHEAINKLLEGLNSMIISSAQQLIDSEEQQLLRAIKK